MDYRVQIPFGAQAISDTLNRFIHRPVVRQNARRTVRKHGVLVVGKILETKQVVRLEDLAHLPSSVAVGVGVHEDHGSDRQSRMLPSPQIVNTSAELLSRRVGSLSAVHCSTWFVDSH